MADSSLFSLVFFFEILVNEDVAVWATSPFSSPFSFPPFPFVVVAVAPIGCRSSDRVLFFVLFFLFQVDPAVRAVFFSLFPIENEMENGSEKVAPLRRRPSVKKKYRSEKGQPNKKKKMRYSRSISNRFGSIITFFFIFRGGFFMVFFCLVTRELMNAVVASSFSRTDLSIFIFTFLTIAEAMKSFDVFDQRCAK